MDRKVEIDRYMMAGPFSWPTPVKMLNEQFVPVRAQPTPEQQKKFELLPFKFIEPGFLVFDSNGELALKMDRVTTMQTGWMERVLESCVSKPLPIEKPKQVADLWLSLIHI